MAVAKVVLDTNIVLDYLNIREPYYEKTRLLMIGGRVGEFALWISSSQITDLIYILSNGGRKKEMPDALKMLRGLRTFVNVFAISEREIDIMLSSEWKDAEDYLVYEIALALQADMIITRDKQGFPKGLVKTGDCDDFFAWLKKDRNLVYDQIDC